MAKEILCGFGIDVDALAGWLTIHPEYQAGRTF